MFTGLIQSTGVFHSRNLSGRAGKLRVRTARAFPVFRWGKALRSTGLPDSGKRPRRQSAGISRHGGEFPPDESGESDAGDLVNLERALAVGDRLGGHIVSGHVDGTGTVCPSGKNGDDTELKVAVSPEVRERWCRKGSSAIDGFP